jgi:hypothetical protein
VAVDAKFVVSVNVPLDAMVWLLADVNPAYPNPVDPVVP